MPFLTSSPARRTALLWGLLLLATTAPLLAPRPVRAEGASAAPPAARPLPLNAAALAQAKAAATRAPAPPAAAISTPGARAASAAPAAAAASPAADNQPGIAAAEVGGTVAAPEASVAAGPLHILQAVDGRVRVTDRAGTEIAAADLAAFVAAPAGTSASGPQVAWDGLAGRWLYAAEVRSSTGGENYLAFGWSLTDVPSDLSGGWCRYTSSTGTSLADSPRLGHDPNFLTLAANWFDGAGSFQTARLWVIAKSTLAGPCPAAPAFTTLPAAGRMVDPHGAPAFGVVPAGVADAGAGAGYLLAAHDVTSGTVAGSGGALTYWQLTPGPDGSPRLGAPVDIPVARYDVPANAPQPGSLPALDTGDGRLALATAATDPATGHEALWTSHTVAALDGTSALRWYEIDASTAGVVQQGSVRGDGDWVFGGAVAPSAAGTDAVAVYNRSGPSRPPLLAVQARTAADAAGTLAPGERILAVSTAPDDDFSCGLSCAWSLGGGAAPDPAAGHSVVVSGQVTGSLLASQKAQWLTRIARIATPLPAAAAGHLQPVVPSRLLDTRNGTGSCLPSCSRLQGGQQLALQVTGAGGVPASGVSAVVLNLTVTNPTTAGFVTAFPAGSGGPATSNLNFTPGQVVANLVEVGVGPSGRVGIYLSAGAADVVADVAGWASGAGVTSGPAGALTPIVPARVLDTRSGLGLCAGGPCARLGENGQLDLRLAGQGGVPATGAWAAVLNVTVTNPSASGYVSAFPAGVGRPVVSNVNFTPGLTVPNRVIVPIGSDGSVSFFNRFGTTDLVVDVGGWYADGTQTSGGSLFAAAYPPARILDTRQAQGACVPSCSDLDAGQTLRLSVAGRGGVPMNATTAVLNVTVANTSSAGYLTLYPTSQSSPPNASDLNWTAGEVIPNLTVVKIGPDGAVNVYNAIGRTSVIVDVMGWYA